MAKMKRYSLLFCFLPAALGALVLFTGCTVVEIKNVESVADAGVIRQSGFADVNDNIEEGVKLLSENNYREAEEKFRSVLLSDPWNLDASLPFGYCLIRLNRFDEADSLFSALIERFPDLKEAYLGAAVSRYSLGDRERAESAVEKGLMLLPEGPEKDAWKARMKLEKPGLETGF